MKILWLEIFKWNVFSDHFLANLIYGRDAYKPKKWNVERMIFFGKSGGRRLKNFLLILFVIFLPSENIFSQDNVLDVGIRLQKSINLYYENGFSVQYTNEKLISQRLFVGFSYVTSRLGSAWGTNALKQDSYLLSTTYMFRPQRIIQPLLRLNAGYFYADLEEEIFNDLPNTSFLLSPETGLSFKTNSPFKVTASLGYNIFTGDGVDGPGTLYPVFLQTTLSWNLIKPKE